jgi:hypothetical protein
MRRIFATGVAGVLILCAYHVAEARSPYNETDLKSHRHYENRDHNWVHSPPTTNSKSLTNGDRLVRTAFRL